MNKIKFISHKNHDIHEYHFSPKDNDKIITDTEYFLKNKLLRDNWCKIEGMPVSYEKFNITNFSCGENILIYMLLISELTLGNDLYGVGIWETDTIEKILNQKPILVNWEYQLEHESCGHNKFLKNDIGYIKAKSPVIKQYGKAINNTPIDKTGLFKIETFQTLSDFLKPGFADNNNMTNFYSTNNISNIKEILTSSEVPVLSEL